MQNYPNPFTSKTIIEFLVPDPGFVNLSVFNDLGEKIAELVNGKLAGGWHKVIFDASGYVQAGTSVHPSGIYFYRLTTGSITESGSMLMIKED